MIYKLGNLVPQIGENNFIAETSSVIGNVETGENVSIWFSAVLRGDMSKIIIGNYSNVQDNTTVHGDSSFPTTVGEKVTIGHNCTIHGCTIGDNCVIGMGSTILNGAIIPKNCIVAAGAVVTSSLKAEEGSLIMGNPAVVVKKLSDKNIDYLGYANQVYVDKLELYKNLERIG